METTNKFYQAVGLSKDDIRNIRSNLEEVSLEKEFLSEEEIDNLTDKEMISLADDLGDRFLSDDTYYDYLKQSVERFIKIKNK